MDNGRTDEALVLRNQASLLIDDLVCLVDSSTIAFDLRAFSEEVMELKPGFGFDFSQAKQLKKLAEQTLNDYKRQKISDEQLMNFCGEARMIIRGQSPRNGGKKIMGFFDKILHGKEIEKQESKSKLERRYREVGDQIVANEKIMRQAVADSANLAPNSREYRDNEFAYDKAKQKLTALQKEEKILRKALSDIDNVELVKEYADAVKAIDKNLSAVIGKDDDLDRTITSAEMADENLTKKHSQLSGIGSFILSSDEEEEAPRTNSAFGAEVAAESRRKAMLEEAGAAVSEAADASESEFDAHVRAAGKGFDET